MQQYLGEGKYVDPHNGFLFTLCEYGFIGFGIFIWMIVKFLISASKICRDDNVPLVYRTYALGMGGLIGSLIACNMVYANFYKELVLGTLAIHFGMLAFIQAECEKKKQEDKGDEKVKTLAGVPSKL